MFYGGNQIITVQATSVGATTTTDEFAIKQGDTLPTFRRQLLDTFGMAIDLTGATVRFKMGEPGRAHVINSPAVILSASLGTVEYPWAVGDTKTPGAYRAEWEITFANGKVMTVPTARRDAQVKIYEEIG